MSQSKGPPVFADRNPDVRVDDLVWLSTSFGRFQARVVHVTRIEPSASQPSGDNPGFRLGLERLQELAAPPAVQPALPETARLASLCRPENT